MPMPSFRTFTLGLGLGLMGLALAACVEEDTPAEVEARIDVSSSGSGIGLRLRLATELRGPCQRCLADAAVLDRLCTHILAFEGDSHVEWFEGDFSSYLEDKKRRLGAEAVEPKRPTFKKFAR